MRQAFRHSVRDRRAHEFTNSGACRASLAFRPSDSTEAAAADPVASFSPQGTVKPIRQVNARFTAPMVALGDPRLADPFDIDCAAKGHGRWADERNWVYDFDADLPAGVRCTFKLRAGLHNRDGAPVVGTRAFQFDSGGPAIRASLPDDGSTIDADQVFMLALDAQATPASIERAAYCAIDGVGERVPVRVLEGDERSAILDQRRELGYSYYRILWKDGASSDRTRARSRTGRRRSTTGGRRLQTPAAERREDAARLGRRHRSAERQSPPRSIRSWRSRYGRRSPHTCNASASTHAPDAFRCSRSACSSARPCRCVGRRDADRRR